MTADQISVDFAALQVSAQTLGMKAKALNEYLDQLHTNLQPIKATWYASGSSAGQAAEQAETRLRQATADIANIIAQFAGKVNEAHDLQLTLENKNARYFA
ncbi:hypothetical protein GCM10010174_20600 [Kutzneria viridogrisea]|uniref:WXG100 family type VII secretion target n=2 Tax=Kutzneria TaxID=43356 RepID=W5WFP0_9PSEU|nr:hypothetical protein [Kutzneria albida]AHH99421.1 hypothetical protein KALB_6061 [Kutzneria albida DSM 43870]MBA8923022.1 uncharacterized protein YukE [Kutzneria viridogrisea]